MGTVKYSQSSQNGKFARSLQYLREEVRDADFLHADKHQSFLQVDFNSLSINVSYKVILSVSDGVHFLLANKHQSFYKLALSFLMKVARYIQRT